MTKFDLIVNDIMAGEGVFGYASLYCYGIIKADCEKDDGYFRYSKTIPHNVQTLAAKFKFLRSSVIDEILLKLKEYGFIEEDIEGFVTLGVEKDSLTLKQEDSELETDIDVVLDEFNKICGTRFKKNTKPNREHIRARLKDGNSVDELVTVIKFMNSKWGSDAKMSAYLRPVTIFSPSKFEGYYSEAVKAPSTMRVRDMFGAIMNISKDRYDRAAPGYYTIIDG